MKARYIDIDVGRYRYRNTYIHIYLYLDIYICLSEGVDQCKPEDGRDFSKEDEGWSKTLTIEEGFCG